MAKVTHHGSAKPDDPIYSEGLQSYVPVSRPSTQSSTRSTAGEASGQAVHPSDSRQMPSINQVKENTDENKTLIFCRENNRVCPLPTQWNRLWEKLPNRSRVGGGWEPSAPLILAAWDVTTGLDKMMRLAEHIEWAARHNQLEVVDAYLRGLSEDEWLHIGD